MRRLLPLGRLLLLDAAKSWAPLETKVLPYAHCMLGNSRQFANLPTDYSRYYDKLEPPRRRILPESQQAVDQSSEEAKDEAQASEIKTPAEGESDAKLQQQSAASVSAWMFPWEKRQMDGQSGPLRSWEKIYWWIFVAAIAFFLYSRLSGKDTVEVADPEEAERKEKRKKTAARLLMAGQPLSEEDEAQFEGLTPKGMSPEEINEMLASAPTGQSLA